MGGRFARASLTAPFLTAEHQQIEAFSRVNCVHNQVRFPEPPKITAVSILIDHARNLGLKEPAPCGGRDSSPPQEERSR